MSLPTSNKLAQLFKLLEREPNDTFLLYGIGMEYKKLGAHEEAIKFFDRTIERDAGYCYAYYQRGQTLELMGKIDDAKLSYHRGVAAAQKVGDAHAAGELQGALDLLT